MSRLRILVAFAVSSVVASVVLKFCFFGILAQKFPAPDGRMSINAYRVIRPSDFMAVMPGDGGWHTYRFRLEKNGEEIRDSEAVRINLKTMPPEWYEDAVRFPGNDGNEIWGTGRCETER